MLDMFWQIGADWSEYKEFVEHSVAFSDDVLHCIIGVAIQLLLALILRSSIDRWMPWVILLILELANEANDIIVDPWPEPGKQLGECTKDVLLTMALPTLLLIVARLKPGLFTGRRRKR